MQQVVDLGFQKPLGIEVAVRQAAAQRMLPDHQEHHRGDHAVHGQVQIHGPELAALHAALQDAPDQLMAWKNHLLVIELRKLGKITRLAEHEFGDARRLGAADALPPGLEAVAQQIGGRCAVVVEFLAPLAEAARDAVAHHGLEKLLLAREIEEQRALGNPGPGGDLFDAGGGVALFHEEVERGFQQLARTLVLAAAALSGRLGGGG